jgi:glutamate 5-kinase
LTEACGTVFTAQAAATKRKAWLAGRLTTKGRIMVDSGAVAALGGGASLLPAGARSVEGRFARGDVVDIVDPNDVVIGRGLSEYDSTEAGRICGFRSEELAAILGHAPRAALVHRDHLVML